MSAKSRIFILCGVSAILLSLPWLVPGSGICALFALVPLLCADRIALDLNWRPFALCVLGTFLVWNFATTFWVCNATVGGGIAACVYNSVWMTVIFLIYRLSRRHFSGVLPYIFLAGVWIALEKAYFSAQFSWPWLTLGHAFATSIALCQWYEYTGVMGGSLWIWAVNLSIFGLMCAFSDGTFRMKRQVVCSVVGVFAIILLPIALSLFLYVREGNASEESKGQLKVYIFQPNIDPYHKFEALNQRQQDDIAREMMEPVLQGAPPVQPMEMQSDTLFVLPETFTCGMLCHAPEESKTVQGFKYLLADHPRITLLMGASTWEFIHSSNAPSYTARPTGMKDVWYESHNSAFTMSGRGFGNIYHKSKLVVGTELMPYPRLFSKIDDALGGVMGRCVGQGKPGVLHSGYVPLGCAVCYESVFGDFCRGYVQEGAEVMTVITNDAWWGDTPGYKQHLSYSSLRAIELRRDIARCANTGISAFINRRGEVSDPTQWWTKQTISGSVNLYDGKTFFVRHGDICGRISVFVALLLGAYLLCRIILDAMGRRKEGKAKRYR